MRNKLLPFRLAVWSAAFLTGVSAQSGVYNLKVITDASPDYADMESMIRSIAGKWETPEEKLWAMFYWNHIARRQTTPMQLHGLALTDPIRQFNDYGYTMCSTISGMNCSIWDAMGFKTKYWDISNHTVSEVEYEGGWHMYDNSMSAIYTLCDGETVAGVADIGQTLACEASEGRSEPGHIAKYHCLTATSARGFLSGADTIRSLDEEYRCFNPNGLKYRSYFHDWDRGHRYILNLRGNETYTRYYHSLGTAPEFFVPNQGKDPEAVNTRYRIRGNGRRTYRPDLAEIVTSAHAVSNAVATADGSVSGGAAGKAGEVIFKIEGANVITALSIRGTVLRHTSEDVVRIDMSRVNGLEWKPVWQSEKVGEQPIDIKLVPEVNGAYEILVRVTLMGKAKGSDAELREMEFETTTMLNSKTQPKLNLGKNTVWVEAGAQTESIVLWPDLQAEHYKEYVVEERNISTAAEHPGYMGVMHASEANLPAYVVFRVDAPRDISSMTYGGRFYNRAPESQIDLLHSLDEGKTWTRTYSLTNTAQPWDVIHYERVDSVPAGVRAVLFKYQLQSSKAGVNSCSLYSVRMEVNHEPGEKGFEPFDVTFNWSERQEDYTLIERSHTEAITRLPHRYTIHVGGADHPIVNFLRVGARGAGVVGNPGYSDGKEFEAEKFMPKWVTYGRNVALGKRYTVSVPSNQQWGAGDPDGTKLTDGIVGPPYPGGTAPGWAVCWNKGDLPDITVDLGGVENCAAFRIQVGSGWPWWDALKGEIKDKVEVLTSVDGESFASHGFFNLNLRWKDLPVNHFWPDEEVIAAHNFELAPPRPVKARYVRYRIEPARSVTVSEVQVLDSIGYEEFDLRLALPGERL